MGSLRRPSFVAAAALLATAGACGSGGSAADAGVLPDAACVDPGALPTPVGRFGSPDDFDRDGCVPGALADFEPDGLWYIELGSQGPFGGGPVRLSLGCEGLSVVRGGLAGPGFDADYVRLDADDLFWRDHVVWDGGSYVDAYDLCRVEEDGSLSGQVGRCVTIGDDEDCWTDTLRLSRYERLEGESEAEGLELVSEWSGAPGFPWDPRAFTANVRVRDGVAYVVNGSDALYVLDVSDPAQPAHLGRLSAGGDDDFNDVKIVDGPGDRRYALIASAARGVLSVDVTDPTSPTIAAAFSPNSAPGHGVHTLFVEQRGATTLAYLADGFSRLLTIFDVTDPSAPAQVGSHLLPENRWAIHDLYVEDQHVYLNATWGGLVVLDASNVAVPIQLGRYADGSYSHSNWVTTAGGRKVSATGGEGYNAHLVIVDVDPESADFMQPLGSFQTRPQASIHNIMAFGDRVYAAWYQDGVRIIDISDPTAPAQAAYFNTWSAETAPGAFLEGAAGIDVDPELGLIYVADSRGLLILRETDR
jgi:hypothetical protein